MEFLTLGLHNAMGTVGLKFLPSQVSNLKAWYRFNSGITETGLGVSQWDDVSGNGNHLKQGTDLDRPQKQADGSILCDGIRQFLKADAFTLVRPEEIYLLGKQVTWTNQDRIYDGNTVNTGAVVQSAITPDVVAYAGAGGLTNSEWTLNTYAVLFTLFRSTSSAIQVNYGAEVTGDTGGGQMGGFTLGADGANGSFSNIQVMEAFIFGAANDAATRSRLINYLANVGGLSI
jgi:hypothetical protein